MCDLSIYTCQASYAGDSSLCIELKPGALPSLTRNQILIQLHSSLVDTRHILGTSQEYGYCGLTGSFLGKVQAIGPEVSGVVLNDYVVGFGILASYLMVSPENCCVVSKIAYSEQEYNIVSWGLALRIFTHLRQIGIQLGERVCILGKGLTGQFIKQLMGIIGIGYLYTFEPNEDPPKEEFDIAIDTTGNLAAIRSILQILPVYGRIVLMAPSYPNQATFNFYPEVHRRSLVLRGQDILSGCDAMLSLAEGEIQLDFLDYFIKKSKFSITPWIQDPLILKSAPGTQIQTVKITKPGLILDWSRVRIPIISTTCSWMYQNIKNLKRWHEYCPADNKRPTVLMVPIYRRPEPFYQTWQEGIELAGWYVCCLHRSYGEIQVADQLLLYFFLCFRVQAIHLIDLDLQTLFGTWNPLRSAISLLVLWLMIWWPRLLGKRIVYSFGNFTPHEFNTLFERRRHQLICSLVDDVISVAPTLTKELIKSGISEERIWPVEHADISHFYNVPDGWPCFRQQYNISQDVTLLLSIGTIRPYKGIEVAIEAIKKTKNTNLQLVIAGQPSAGYSIESIKDMVAGDNRIVLGPLRLLSNEEMGWMFQEADYCLLPYRDVGHSGLVCQSLGLGVPVIASNVGSLPDYLCTGAGILFNPGDVDHLTEIFNEQLGCFDHARAKAIGIGLMRQRTTERIGKRLVRVYEYRKGGPVPERNWLF